MREGQSETAATLAWVLDRTLRLVHPIMPFVTEEVWQRLEVGESIVVAPWPEPQPEHEDLDAEQEFERVQALVYELRRLRPLIQLGPGYQLVVDESIRPVAEPMRTGIERLTGSSLDFSAEPRLAGRSIRLSVAGVRASVEVPAGFDPEPARAARRKRLQEVTSKQEQSARKLANEQFVARAKPEAVERERQNQTALQQQELHIREELEQLERIEGE